VPTSVVVHIHPNLSRISGRKIDMGLFEKRVPMGPWVPQKLMVFLIYRVRSIRVAENNPDTMGEIAG
jgi:hypothetical protein